MQSTSKREKGFIALMSAVIIGAVLLVTVIGSSLLGFYSRYNALDFELKERSAAAADACASEALLNLANDPSYPGGGAVNPTLRLNSLDSCYIGAMHPNTPSTGETSFRVQATSSDAVTDLAITVNSSDLTVLSWLEIPNF